jgi:hypothetical protein
MQIRQIRYFLAVCAERNFTRAARKCGVAQPSLTQALMRLEAELGGNLFERGKRESRLTELGKLVQAHLADIDRVERLVKRKALAFASRQQDPSRPNSTSNGGSYEQTHVHGDRNDWSGARSGDGVPHHVAGDGNGANAEQSRWHGHQRAALER